MSAAGLKTFAVEFSGEVQVQATSPEDAERQALTLVTTDAPSHLFWDVETIRACRFCGCTYSHACEGGCAWLEGYDDVCDAPVCVEKLSAEVIHG